MTSICFVQAQILSKTAAKFFDLGHGFVQLFLGFLAIGDVFDLRNKEERRAVIGLDQRNAKMDSDDGTALVEIALLHLVSFDFAAQKPAGIIQVEVQIVGMSDVLKSSL